MSDWRICLQILFYWWTLTPSTRKIWVKWLGFRSYHHHMRWKSSTAEHRHIPKVSIVAARAPRVFIGYSQSLPRHPSIRGPSHWSLPFKHNISWSKTFKQYTPALLRSQHWSGSLPSYTRVGSPVAQCEDFRWTGAFWDASRPCWSWCRLIRATPLSYHRGLSLFLRSWNLGKIDIA